MARAGEGHPSPASSWTNQSCPSSCRRTVSRFVGKPSPWPEAYPCRETVWEPALLQLTPSAAKGAARCFSRATPSEFCAGAAQAIPRSGFAERPARKGCVELTACEHPLRYLLCGMRRCQPGVMPSRRQARFRHNRTLLHALGITCFSCVSVRGDDHAAILEEAIRGSGHRVYSSPWCSCKRAST